MSQNIWVFYNADKTAITGFFRVAQDPAVYPGLTETTTADPLYGSYYAALPPSLPRDAFPTPG